MEIGQVMLPNERASMAVSALKAMGICEKRVRPVLKSLLRLYDKNWELIEDENYRVLIDAIFEQEVEEEETKKNKETPSNDESSGPPLKRMRLRNQADRVPTSGETSSIRPKVEEDDRPIGRRTRSAEHDSISSQHDKDEQEIPVSSLALARLDTEEPSQLFLRDRAERNPVSPQSRSRDKGKEPISPSQICRREEAAQRHSHLNDNVAECDSLSAREPTSPQLTYREKGALCAKGDLPARSSSGVRFKEPKVEPGIIILPKEKLPDFRPKDGLIRPKSEPTNDYLPLEDPTDDYLPFEVPIAIMAPPNPERTVNDDPLHKDDCSTVNGSTGQINGSTVQMNGAESLASKDRHNDTSDRSCKSAMGSELVNVPETPTSFEIASSPSGEVKISLNCNQSFERPDFHIPSLDAVLKAVEDKCLRSYRILEPNFSMKNLMQEMCQTYLELSNSSSDPKADSFVLTPDFNFLRKSNLQNAFGAKGDQKDNIPRPASLSNESLNLRSSAEVVLSETPKTLLLNGLDSHHNRKADDDDPNSSNSRSLVVVPQQELRIDVVRTLHDVNDISKGEERVRISLINEVSSDPYPPTFYYIPRNIVYQSAYVNFSLARIGDEDCCSNCFGDCLSSSIPCACARETGGEFAYTLEGLVKEKLLDECISMNRDPQQHRHYYCKECPLERSKEGLSDPCKGHLVRKFIKECWSKCGCNKQCGNRVVQRGIACNLQVFLTSEGKGWGLRTLEDLPRGTFVCEYVGEVLTNTELYERNLRSTGNEKHTYPVLLDADWGSEGVLKDEEALCLDATYYGNVARFINHRCFDANLVEIPVEVETPDHHYYHLAFFTTKKVDALEELTWDYGIDFNDHNHPVKAFRCSCGSKCCRDLKRSHKTKSRR